MFLEAPKKTSEGLQHVQKGTGDKPSIGINTISMQQGLSNILNYIKFFKQVLTLIILKNLLILKF